jgi:hypothetical protein
MYILNLGILNFNTFEGALFHPIPPTLVSMGSAVSVGSNDWGLKILKKKICTDHVQIFFLLLFPKQCSVTTIHMVFTLHWLL